MRDTASDIETPRSHEPRHPIQIVSRRTGLTPDVIRVWERRYRAVTPDRSPTNRRLYSDDDLDRLVLLRRATLAGRAIGHVAHLASGELRRLVESDEAATKGRPGASPAPGTGGEGEAAARLESSIAAVRALDAVRLRSILASATIEMGPLAAIENLLVPLMTLVGDEWQQGRMRIHHEHLTTALVRFSLESMRNGNTGSCSGPDLVIATLPGEQHELGALMAAVVAGVEGWHVTFLGSDLPVDEIAAAVCRRGARAVAVSLVQSDTDERFSHEIVELRRLLPPGVVILAGGQAAPATSAVLSDVGAILVGDLTQLRVALERLRESPS